MVVVVEGWEGGAGRGGPRWEQRLVMVEVASLLYLAILAGKTALADPIAAVYLVWSATQGPNYRAQLSIIWGGSADEVG